MARPKAAVLVSRDRVFAAAAAEFAARGYAGANMDRIARAARLNKAMIYYHFKSKAALYREILRDMFGAVRRRVAAVAFAARIVSDAPGALRLLRVAAAGFLLLLALAAPPILARRESGRDLFVAVRGREVLAWGATRAAWMAGYFYNDGKVREVAGLGEVAAAAARGPALVICGPAERRLLTAAPGLATRILAEGPRDSALVRVALRP